MIACQAMHEDALKAMPGREIRNHLAALASKSPVLTPTSRFLELRVYLEFSSTLSDNCCKSWANQWPRKSKTEFRAQIVVLLCVCGKQTKKARTLFGYTFLSKCSLWKTIEGNSPEDRKSNGLIQALGCFTKK